MIASLIAFFSGFFQLIIFGLVIVGGFLLVMGFMSTKGMFRRLKNGDMFRGGRTGYNQGYRHGSHYNDGYESRRGYGDRRGYNEDRRDYGYNRGYDNAYREEDLSQVSAEHFEYELGRRHATKRRKVPKFGLNLGGSKFINKFKTKESFDNYIRNVCSQGDTEQPKVEEDYVVFDGNRADTIDSVKDILSEIYDAKDCIVCDRAGVVSSVQTLQSNDTGKIKSLQESSLSNVYKFGADSNELFILVKGRDIKSILKNDNPRDFLSKQLNVKVDKSVCSSLVKTTTFNFKGDVQGCRFLFVEELKSSAENIAENVSKGSINRSVAEAIQRTETVDTHAPSGYPNTNTVEKVSTKQVAEEKEVSENSIEKIQIDTNETLDSVKTTEDDEITIKPSEPINSTVSIGKIGSEE